MSLQVAPALLQARLFAQERLIRLGELSEAFASLDCICPEHVMQSDKSNDDATQQKIWPNSSVPRIGRLHIQVRRERPLVAASVDGDV